MKTIKVFPDYMSSGLWLVVKDHPFGACNISMDVSEVEHFIPAVVRVGLKYWHHVWELMCDDNYNSTMSGSYYEEWYEDGRKLVEIMNYHAWLQNQDYQFIFAVGKEVG